MRRFNRFALLLGVTAALAATIASPGDAQTRTPLSPDKPSHQTVPEAQGSGGSGEPLSDKLDRSGGVIKPPADIDTGLTKSPPNLGGEGTPVIRPPGTPGGKLGANPK